MPRFLFFVCICMIIAIPIYNKITNLNKVNASLIGNVAIRGYDPVSFFTEEELQAGNEDLEVIYAGAKWRFATDIHKAMFEAAPEDFMPQFGGYCAYGVANNYLADGSPRFWLIDGEKLYFFFSEGQLVMWSQNKDVLLKRSPDNWEQLSE